jgi:ATP/maltotriose-dependent transcriptional regulator MalT
VSTPVLANKLFAPTRRERLAARPQLLDVSGISQQTAPTPDQDGMPDPLSGRDLDVLRLLDSDLTGPQIAPELYVSLSTLSTHTKRIFTEPDVNTRVTAVRRARERGFL